MTVDEMVLGNAQYRMILGTWQVFRLLGFQAIDIHVWFGINYAVVLKTQGKEFSMAFERIEGPQDEFRSGWMKIAKSLVEMSHEVGDRCLADWNSKWSRVELVMGLHAKGIRLNTDLESGPTVH